MGFLMFDAPQNYLSITLLESPGRLQELRKIIIGQEEYPFARLSQTKQLQTKPQTTKQCSAKFVNGT